jgi:hypothetical protein
MDTIGMDTSLLTHAVQRRVTARRDRDARKGQGLMLTIWNGCIISLEDAW